MRKYGRSFVLTNWLNSLQFSGVLIENDLAWQREIAFIREVPHGFLGTTAPIPEMPTIPELARNRVARDLVAAPKDERINPARRERDRYGQHATRERNKLRLW